ncbi:MAG: FAD-dependent oxidoreductase [Candidatus Baltobacteraceae bacterium]
MVEFDAAVIGGGFSGCAVAAHLARRAGPGFSLCLFEPGELGRGAAYGTQHAEHVLNTRAQQMSLYSDEPDHFVRWLDGRAGPTDFVSRRLYGEYVNQISAEIFVRPGFARIRDRATVVRRENGGFVIASPGAAPVHARSVVLATGNPLPGSDHLFPDVLAHPGYIGDPWRFDYRAVGGHVLVIGSGHTALDVLVALNASGHRGAVHVLSRHGLYPQAHAPVGEYDVIPALDTSNARFLLGSFRRHLDDAARRGFDWRAVIDALRPEAEATWRRLPQVERRRFERHLRGRWERHRHRIPPHVESVLASYQRSKRLFTYAGRLAAMRDGNATIAMRGGGTIALHPDWIVNCAGLGSSAMTRDPLLAGLLADGEIATEPGGLGLRVTPELGAIGATGAPTPGLWIVGPPVRGSRFEATAVPEIRAMAELAARALLAAPQPQYTLDVTPAPVAQRST